jgi:hypothetical protein
MVPAKQSFVKEPALANCDPIGRIRLQQLTPVDPAAEEWAYGDAWREPCLDIIHSIQLGAC